MEQPRQSTLKRVNRHIRTRLISGMLLLIPVVVTILFIQFVVTGMASFLTPFVKRVPGISDQATMAVSTVLFVLLVYAVGVIAAHIMGRRLLGLGESVLLHIPVIRTIYAASKQVVDSFSLSNRSTFKSAVLVEFPRKGSRAIAFVMGASRDRQGVPVYRVFVPTAPNPTSGFLLILREDQMRQTAMPVEEALKMIVSGGVLGPDEFDLGPSDPDRQ